MRVPHASTSASVSLRGGTRKVLSRPSEIAPAPIVLVQQGRQEAERGSTTKCSRRLGSSAPLSPHTSQARAVGYWETEVDRGDDGIPRAKLRVDVDRVAFTVTKCVSFLVRPPRQEMSGRSTPGSKWAPHWTRRGGRA